MESTFLYCFLLALVFFSSTHLAHAKSVDSTANTAATRKVIHVFVALRDNKYQGIVPVPEKIGDGQNPNANLY